MSEHLTLLLSTFYACLFAICLAYFNSFCVLHIVVLVFSKCFHSLQYPFPYTYSPGRRPDQTVGFGDMIPHWLASNTAKYYGCWFELFIFFSALPLGFADLAVCFPFVYLLFPSLLFVSNVQFPVHNQQAEIASAKKNA